jgi:hypothetical protein
MQLHGSFQDLRQSDDLVTVFMQKVNTLFDKLVVTSQPVSLEDFNLYLFHGLRGEFKDLVKNPVTKAKPLLYAELHSHFFTHEFLHKTSLLSMYVIIITHLLLIPAQPPSTYFAQHQTFGSYNNNYNFRHGRGRSLGGWCNNYNSNHNSTNIGSDFQGFNGSLNSN